MQPLPPPARRPACPDPWQAAPSASGVAGTTQGARDDGRDRQCSFSCGLPLPTRTFASFSNPWRGPIRPTVSTAVESAQAFNDACPFRDAQLSVGGPPLSVQRLPPGRAAAPQRCSTSVVIATQDRVSYRTFDVNEAVLARLRERVKRHPPTLISLDGSQRVCPEWQIWPAGVA
jgi:hypothetical protein